MSSEPDTPKTPQAQPVDFERALGDLEQLVEALEQGELPLEEAVRKFEQGMQLSAACRGALDAAEQKVRVLLENEAGDEQLTDFDPER